MKKEFSEEELLQKILENQEEILKRTKPVSDAPFGWWDNAELLQKLHISPRTAQTLRDKKKLPFSKIGSKIYYRRRDVEQMLMNKLNNCKYEY